MLPKSRDHKVTLKKLPNGQSTVEHEYVRQTEWASGHVYDDEAVARKRGESLAKRFGVTLIDRTKPDEPGLAHSRCGHVLRSVTVYHVLAFNRLEPGPDGKYREVANYWDPMGQGDEEFLCDECVQELTPEEVGKLREMMADGS